MTKEELYNKYKYLIFKVMKDINCQFKDQEEFQYFYDYGELGLLRAINDYDYRTDGSTYFYICIKTSIMVSIQMKERHKRKINYINLLSLDLDNENNINNYEVIKDERIDLEKEILINDLENELHKCIKTLKPSYQNIICNYYGINTKEKTLEQIAKTYKTTKQSILVRRNKALQILKKKLLEKGVSKNDLRLYD